MAIFKAQNLVKHFDGITAVDGLTFSIDKGTIAALVGPNGAGKTTFFNIITGFLKPDAGEAFVNFNDKVIDISSLSSHRIARLGLARTFQNMRLFSQMTVLDNLMLASRGQNHERLFTSLFAWKKINKAEKENLEIAIYYLDFVGLTNKKEILAEDLSHGQRKLLSLARALCMEPEILLLDEPIAGVFPETRRKIANLLQELRSQGKTILFIEHDMQFVVSIADKIIVINEGKKLKEGKPNDVIKDPTVIEAYLGKQIS